MQNNSSTSSSFEQRLDAVKDSLRRLIDNASERAAHLKDRTMEVEHQAEDQARSVAATAIGWIKAHPVAAVAGAFALGYVAIRIARR